MADIMKRVYEAVGLGKLGNNSHPVHPSTIHLPIACQLIANGINIAYGILTYLPSLSLIPPTKENSSTLTVIGYWVNVIGVVTCVPALISGFAELYAMVQGRGLYFEEVNNGKKEKRLEPVVKMTLTHASLNDITIFGAVYHWLMERNRSHEDYRPYGHQVLLSAGAIFLTIYAAYLGGSLVYKHGVGVQRQGDGAREKEEHEKEPKKSN